MVEVGKTIASEFVRRRSVLFAGCVRRQFTEYLLGDSLELILYEFVDKFAAFVFLFLPLELG